MSSLNKNPFPQANASHLAICWLCWVSLFIIPAKAFSQQPSDSAAVASQPLGKTRKLSFSLILDNRYSFFRENAVKMNGVNIGVKIHKRYRIGMGVYTLNKTYNPRYIYSSSRKPLDTLTAQLNQTFFTPNFTYIFFTSRWIDINMPVAAGMAHSDFTIRSEKTSLQKKHDEWLFTSEIGLGLLLKPSRWIGVSGHLSYRKTASPTFSMTNYNGWYYGYNINIFFGNILADWKLNRQKKGRNAVPVAIQPISSQ